MKIITITNNSFRLFEYMMTDAAKERLAPGPGRREDTFALGAVDQDGFPLGAIAVKCDPPTAEVISLYVLRPNRRTGIGRELLLEAITDSMTLPEITELIVPYGEQDQNGELTSFFKGLDLDVVDVGADYRITAKDALRSAKLNYKPRKKVLTEAWQDLKSSEQRILFGEGAGLMDYYAQGKLREDLVFVSMEEDRRAYRGCIAVVEDEGELILAWLRAEKAPFIMVELLHRVLAHLEENGEQDKVVQIPTINSASDAMVRDLFGKNLTVEYYSKRVVFDFA